MFSLVVSPFLACHHCAYVKKNTPQICHITLYTLFCSFFCAFRLRLCITTFSRGIPTISRPRQEEGKKASRKKNFSFYSPSSASADCFVEEGTIKMTWITERTSTRNRYSKKKKYFLRQFFSTTKSEPICSSRIVCVSVIFGYCSIL